MPAIPPNEFLKPSRQKRQVKVKNFESCETKNILDRHISNNDRGFIVEHFKTEQLKHSWTLYVRTVVEWTHTNTATPHAETVESFKQAHRLDSSVGRASAFGAGGRGFESRGRTIPKV